MGLNRRNVLALGAVGVGFYAASQAVPLLLPGRTFEFEPVERPVGFRRIPRSDGLSAATLLTGFAPTDELPLGFTDRQICDLTFGGHGTGQGELAIGLFSDFFCPYCRVLDVQVRELAARDPRIAVIPHEVPLLGRPSQLAARAVIAASRQGAYDDFHSRLIRTTFVPNPAYVRTLADEAGIDVAQFQKDMNDPQTDQQLAISLNLFRIFGFVGTPALVVGQTLLNGAISLPDLRALFRLELGSDAPAICT